MRIYSFLLITVLLLFSCSKTKQGDLLEIPINIDQDSSLPLSSIAEMVETVDLELTDNSLINPDRIKRVLLCENYVIIAEQNKILVFNNEGKFVRSIGSKGQGPGEYTGIRNIAIDEINKRLFVNAISKIICYDLSGNFLMESTRLQDGLTLDINYINNELLIIVEYIGRKDASGLFNHSAIYRLNDDLQIIDSCTIRDTYFERPGFYTHNYDDFILNGKSTPYLYYSDIYFSNMQKPAETVLRDTLYRLENNHLVPDLKLKFKGDGIDDSGNKFIELFNIYRSSRYLFAVYGDNRKNTYYRFCYDTKTGKGYNMKDGYTDDINKIDKCVSIRPLNTNPEMFYYLHTNMKPDDLEEPNPTLYIGKLKK